VQLVAGVDQGLKTIVKGQDWHTECYRKSQASCGSCGEELKPGQGFCGGCGTRVAV
jgi:hypothetical protein